MIVLDFDGVLFNDRRFKAEYTRLLRSCGAPSVLNRTVYARTRELHKDGYRHDVHLALLKKRLPAFDARDAERKIDKLLARSPEYLFRDGQRFISHWSKRGQKLALISSGYIFQKKKVRASGLLSFFIWSFVGGTRFKVEPMQKLIRRFPHERIIFIDDRKSVLDQIKKRLPQIYAIQVVRTRDRERSQRADAAVKNLFQASRLCERALEKK